MLGMKDDQYKKFGEEFLKTYLALGFGVLSKKEVELLIFSLIEKSPDLKGKSNYVVSNALKITESRLKSLRLESAMRFATPNSKVHLGNIVQRLIDVDLTPSIQAGKIELLLENPIEAREYENAAKLAGHHVDFRRNREIVLTTPDVLLDVIVANAEKGSEHFKALVQSHISSTKLRKEILEGALTRTQRVSKFLSTVANPAAIIRVITAAKGWLPSDGA